MTDKSQQKIPNIINKDTLWALFQRNLQGESPEQIKNEMVANAHRSANIFNEYNKDYIKRNVGNRAQQSWQQGSMWDKIIGMLASIFGVDTGFMKDMKKDVTSYGNYIADDAKQRHNEMFKTMVRRYEKEHGVGSYMQDQIANKDRWNKWVEAYQNKVNAKTQQARQTTDSPSGFSNQIVNNKVQQQIDKKINDRDTGYDAQVTQATNNSLGTINTQQPKTDNNILDNMKQLAGLNAANKKFYEGIYPKKNS